MKVVLLAGGLGTRMREQTELRPKPMVEVGRRPVLWHIMKWFAGAGFDDFVVLTGYKSDHIKQYFANYRVNNFDFQVQLGDPDSLRFMGTHDEREWKVTILDTGFTTPTGGRLKLAEPLLAGHDFMCTYGDGLADVDLSALLDAHRESGAQATVTVARPRSRFGEIVFTENRLVTGFHEKPEGKQWVSMGYFVFSTAVFEHLHVGSVLEEEPMRKLIEAGGLRAFPHEGFWQPMDTQREFEHLNTLWDSGNAPWVRS